MVTWGHFFPLQVPIWGGSGPKYGYFWVNIRPLWRAGSRGWIWPGKCFMSHITPQCMGQHYSGPFLPSPSTYLVQWGSENHYFWVKNSHWKKIAQTAQVSPEWLNHHHTPSLDMKQWYNACLTTLGPIRPSSGTPHDKGVFTSNTAIWPPGRAKNCPEGRKLSETLPNTICAWAPLI